MNTMPSPTTTNTLQPEAPSSSPEVALKNKSTTAGMMMDQTPKHRNTSTNALSKLDYSEDYGGVNLSEGDLRPRGSTAINSGAINGAAINNSNNNGARRFPGMRTAAPPPDYNTTTTSRLRPPPPHHPSTASAYHHHSTTHREYGRTYEGSYDDYIHDLSAPLPDYDVPPSYSLFGRDPHRPPPHHRELPREHRMPRERIVDYHSGGGGRGPPPPHHYYRPPPPQYYDYYDGYYRDHDYRPSVSGGGEVNGGGEGRSYWEGGRPQPTTATAPTTNGGGGGGFGEDRINHHHTMEHADSTGDLTHQERGGMVEGTKEEGKSLRAVSGSFSVTASKSSEHSSGHSLDQLSKDGGEECQQGNDNNKEQQQGGGGGADEKDKDIAVVLASMDGSTKNATAADEDGEAAANSNNHKSPMTKSAPSSNNNNNRNDELLEVTSSLSQSPDDHPHNNSNMHRNSHHHHGSHHHHHHHQGPLAIRKKAPTPSKLHYMIYQHPQQQHAPQYHNHHQQQQRDPRNGRLVGMMAPPPPVATTTTTAHITAMGAGYDEESPSASTISTKASQFMSIDRKEAQQQVMDESRGDVEQGKDEEEDAPPNKRQRRASSTASTPSAAAAATAAVFKRTGGGGGDGLPDLSGMPSWDTTRTTASGPGTISGWSVCSNLASGTGAAVGKDGGAAATTGGGGVAGKEGGDVLLNSATSPGDGDSLYRAGVLSAFSFSSENFGRANGAASTFSLPSATAAMGGAAGGGEDDISPKSILSKDGKNKKSMPQGTHVQFSRGGGEEGSIPGASASLPSSSGRKRMAPHLSRSPYDDYYDYPPTRYHHAPPPPSHHHSYYDSPSHHRSSRYHPDDAYYADSHYHHPYPPPPHHSRGGGGGGGGYNARHHYHHGPPPPSSGGGHYYDRHLHDFPPSPSPTHHHRQYLHGGQLDDSLRGSSEGGASASSGSASRRTPRSSSSVHSRDELPTGHLRCANFPNPHGWTKEEDTALITIMKGTKKNPQSWSPIGHQLGRSPDDCRERWTRFLKPGARKGQWTEEEDNAVIKAVQSAGPDGNFTRWSELASHLPGRVGKQVRDRWVNHLNPNINHLPFSKEDDLLLWEGHSKVGKRWVEISSTFFKGTRSENHIKNRWYSASFKKFITSEFGEDSFVSGSNKGVDSI